MVENRIDNNIRMQWRTESWGRGGRGLKREICREFRIPDKFWGSKKSENILENSGKALELEKKFIEESSKILENEKDSKKILEKI